MSIDFVMNLMQVIFVNVILSGDNAVVIALACKNVDPKLQKKAIVLGSAGAIGLRIILTFIAAWVLKIPLILFIAGIILCWIAMGLLKGEDESISVKSSNNLIDAFKTILIADVVMSIDNVIAVTGAAKGNLSIVIIGLIISIPIIIWGSHILMKVMNKVPIIVTLGAALLGYISGEMVMGDQIIGGYLHHIFSGFDYILPISLAIFVVLIGKVLKHKIEKVEQIKHSI
ncbi:integral membrane protein, YjbE family [Marininema mesophilum]|uniref:Integral membrane protein, YjbE family n=1 Tax=Marininema mesophilum TaxID=1048340 RepID=A0A1H2YKQ6_9BACL|nr:TerC family protein [Marininema mesophilum]SDX05660.1 integral membrane protein, YjbE family [Marininema mesophilum]